MRAAAASWRPSHPSEELQTCVGLAEKDPEASGPGKEEASWGEEEEVGAVEARWEDLASSVASDHRVSARCEG